MPPKKKHPKVLVLDLPRTTLDIMQSAKARQLIENRRQTGMPTGKEMLQHVLKEQAEEEKEEAKQLSKPVSKKDESSSSSSNSEGRGRGESLVVEFRGSIPRRSSNLSMARHMVRLSVLRRLGSSDPEDSSCGHKEDEWCTCPNRFHGFSSTFVDKEQPPYTIWHAGTDNVKLNDLDSVDDFSEDLQSVDVFNMTGENGFCVQMCNYGAQVTSIVMRDSEGLLEEILPSFPNMIHAQNNSHLYMTGMYGRVGAHVTNGSIKGKGFYAQLELNDDNKHHINGGAEAGFDRLPWQAAVAGNELVFTLLLPDGASGYPGVVLLTARYCVRPCNTLVFRLTATCTKACPMLPVMRLPLNLAGHGSGKCGMEEHVIKINASHYFVSHRKDSIPLGRERHVAETVYDMRISRELGFMHPLAPWPGYRVYYRLDGKPTSAAQTDGVRPGEGDADEDEDAPLPFAAKLYHPQSRRAVELRTNQPVLYFETARMTLPTDPEDVGEEARRAHEERKRIIGLFAEEAAAQAVKEAIFGPKESRGEDAEDKKDDDDQGNADDDDGKVKFDQSKVPKGNLAFSENIMQFEFETPKHVYGRGGFLYSRCGAITLQPQKEPLFRTRKLRNGRDAPVDGSRQVLQPGRRLLYAATWRFYLEPRMKKPRKRSTKVRYAKSDERLDDVRAKFDMCDIEVPSPVPSGETSGEATPTSHAESLAPGDLQADRCSVESLFRSKGRFDRKFLGPPDAAVPSPQRRRDEFGSELMDSLLDSVFNSAYMLDILNGMLGSFPEDDSTLESMLGKLLLLALDTDASMTPMIGRSIFNSLTNAIIHDPYRPTYTPDMLRKITEVAAAQAQDQPQRGSSALDYLPDDERRSILHRLSGIPKLPEGERQKAMKNISQELRDSINQRISTLKSLRGDRRSRLSNMPATLPPSERAPLHPSMLVAAPNSIGDPYNQSGYVFPNETPYMNRDSVFGADDAAHQPMIRIAEPEKPFYVQEAQDSSSARQ